MLLYSVGGCRVVFTDRREWEGPCPRERLGEVLAHTLGRQLPVLVARQRHTATVYTFSGKLPAAGTVTEVGVCDALVTAEVGVALAVQTADCLPVVLVGERVVGVVHAGWRGLAQGILPKTVRLIEAQFGLAAASLQALLGVAIGPCHYPVGEEVVAALAAALGRDDGFRTGSRVNLQAFAQLSLQNAGVSPDSIFALPGCTACSPFHHSYRRDGPSAGRQWTAAVLLPC